MVLQDCNLLGCVRDFDEHGATRATFAWTPVISQCSVLVVFMQKHVFYKSCLCRNIFFTIKTKQ